MQKLLSLLLLAFLAACSVTPPPEKLVLKPARFADLPGWGDYENFRAVEALRESCALWLKKPEKRPATVGEMQFPAANWNLPCLMADRVQPGQTRGFFETYFQPYAVDNGRDEPDGLLTAYYEPLLHGAYQPDARYRYPVWGVPTDLVAGQPYLTHREIYEQGLHGRAEALLYVDDYVDLFFLQIQGSGRVQLPDGTITKLGFAGKNGHGYTAIGKVLIEREELPREGMSMQVLKDWLRKNPDQALDVMFTNESYVFFRLLDEKGPIGAQGVALTPEGSLAIDDAFYPYGLPFWLDTTLPDMPGIAGGQTYRQLVVAQDTGGAILGVVRGDLFMGYGEMAEALAGHMKQPVRFWLLLPRALRCTLAFPHRRPAQSPAYLGQPPRKPPQNHPYRPGPTAGWRQRRVFAAVEAIAVIIFLCVLKVFFFKKFIKSSYY
jgi:membrane-bound lytic murein transglycosylase A